MSNSKKLIILVVVAVVVVAIIAISLTYAFMKPGPSENAVTEVNIQACSKIKITNETSINDLLSYAVSRNVALSKTPYTFTVSNNCTGSESYNLYIATLTSNTLPASEIHYILINSNNSVVSEGILSEATVSNSSLTNEELSQYSSGVSGTIDNVYSIYTSSLSSSGSETLNLYLYIDENSTQPNTSKTFNAGIAVKVV